MIDYVTQRFDGWRLFWELECLDLEFGQEAPAEFMADIDPNVSRSTQRKMRLLELEKEQRLEDLEALKMTEVTSTNIPSSRAPSRPHSTTRTGTAPDTPPLLQIRKDRVLGSRRPLVVKFCRAQADRDTGKSSRLRLVADCSDIWLGAGRERDVADGGRQTAALTASIPQFARLHRAHQYCPVCR
jgi:hypothetical protein